MNIDPEILRRFGDQLNKLNSVTTCFDPIEYKQESISIFTEIVEQLGSFGNMPPTVHRVLVHGHVFLQKSKDLDIPLGRFSESANEYRNKDRRKARLHFARKNSRENNTKDTYHYLLKTSDPVVNNYN